MNWNILLFQVFPYVALALLVIVSFQRMRGKPFSVSSLSSQLLERRLLFFGSVPFHWGVLIILLGHLLALLVPQGLLLWNAVPIRLYLLEISGLALALWTLGGLLVLLYRRLSNRRVLAVTRPTDVIVLLLLLVSILTGILTAVMYRYGSYWFPSVFTPYLWSILTLRPRPELVADLPFWIQLHVFNFWVLLAVFPFTRLIHIITVPLGYLWRPWQLVIWVRKPRRLQPVPPVAQPYPTTSAKPQAALQDKGGAYGSD
ncbi:respiratory nitrate reductase subunit gamma [Meiothermus hypogaeus]|uniref:Nitrate reductase subunit gamma n=2 Tax=Meiothermus hypogaeus TaxID=884155 RepID=A0A511QX55_9DEIN|nr:respiratory nitrate reductase subunit gamma [Meiothermus hypogaeus]RIH75398.1 Nitrate reductase-like protein NarX [Meiothermus hypogaeus]GEM81964.1 nitrate reductase subunit gamma [Meiothermus hypogaeus NBRC 106114]GIW36904.1 MAG: nitrate reductase subunit gamma [Meiothermus sp.]